MKSKTRISKFFETLIYFILLTIPMISVFARTIYVQANPNAKDSYYGYKINNYDKVYLTADSVINTDETYYTTPLNMSWSSAMGNIYVKNLTIDYIGNLSSTDYSLITAHYNDINRIYFGMSGTAIRFTLYYNNNGSSSYLTALQSTNNAIFKYNIISTDNSNNLVFTYYLNYLPNSFLDNAFDYGLQKTIDDFGNGNINFLNWFGTMFSNNNNLLYINFVNMYLNYALWVSVGYLIYYFLNWFVRFVRETLDNLIYKETKN